MSEERTVQCPICKSPYVFYPFSAADQSACPSCVDEARANMRQIEVFPLRRFKPVTQEDLIWIHNKCVENRNKTWNKIAGEHE